MSRLASSATSASQRDSARAVTRRRYLLARAFAPSTLTKYVSAVRDFVVWCVEQGEDPVDMPSLDDLLTDYLHHLYESGAGRAAANCTYYGLIAQLPTLKHNLPTSLLVLRAFARLKPSVSYPPLTWELTVAIAVQLCRHGWRHAAIAALLGFDCLLRISELVGLHVDDVADAGDPRLNVEHTGMSLRIRKAKTGVNQWVSVRDPAVMALLRGLLAVQRQGSLFSFTAAVFRAQFKHVCRELGLSSGYVPHSLRHGGATHLHLLRWSLEDILMRGRWESTKSARRYVQAGRALQIAVQHVPSHIVALARLFASDVVSSLSLAQSH